jgi:hypothetical protein
MLRLNWPTQLVGWQRVLLVSILAVGGSAAAASAQAPPTAPTGAPVVELARSARTFEDEAAYDSAAAKLRALRARVAPDADLDLALALDLARCDSLESSRALLYGPTLSAALADSTPPERRRPYGPRRDETWLTGRFEGWRWFVARARAEVDGRTGRWREARTAARLAVTERPLLGREWLVLAVCAARDGDLTAGEREARLAAILDPMLPEAQYLVGLFEWRAGRRAATLERFAAAVALDSLYAPAVRARQRLRFFPGAPPDSFPRAFLTGIREAGLLASPAGPKLESAPRVDAGATVLQRTMVPVPESLQVEIRPLRLLLPVLVDERGRAVMTDLPWISPQDLPAPLVALLLQSLPGWRFAPARRFGVPVRSWTAVTLTTGSE